MGRLQATWIDEDRLFFWAQGGSVDDVISEEIPELRPLLDSPDNVALVVPGPVSRRKKVRGYAVGVGQVSSLLHGLRDDEYLSDSIRCWSVATRLAVEIASRQQVVPRVRLGHARWGALLSRSADQMRFHDLVHALPLSSRLAPTRDRGALRLHTADKVLRGFIDAVLDSLYRRKVYPGPSRGWTLELADSLRGESSVFRPTEARFHGIPDKLKRWADSGAGGSLRVGMTLELPDDGSDRFRLCFFVCPYDDPSSRAPIDAAWSSGTHVTLGDRDFPHPAYRVLQGLARAKRIFEPIGEALKGRRPRDLTWGPEKVWRFIAQGAQPLLDAGFEVELPESFRQAGSRRIRARMCIETAPGVDLNLTEMLSYRWEVVLGEHVLTGDEFADLLGRRKPIVRWNGEWVLLDPAELARLPDDMLTSGKLSGTAALRAVLTGQHEGVPVVADDRLGMVIEALREPPDTEPPDGLEATLRPYQRDGFSWLTTLGNLGLGACLADDMGLGKTVQVIGHLLRRHRRSPGSSSLVVCPTSLLGNWTHELNRFAPELSVTRYHGNTRSVEACLEGDIVLTTYGLLSRDIELLEQVKWETAVLDEAQAIKNPDSQRAKAASRLQARHKVAMSGTPVENRLEELWSLMHFLLPGLLADRAHFRRTVAIPVERFDDQEVAQRLRLGVSPFMLRRVKTDPDIISDLPDKVERKDFCSLSPEQASLYRSVTEEALAVIQESEAMERRGRVLAMLTALKQICNHPAHYLKEEGSSLAQRSGKFDRTTEVIRAVVECDEKVILFTQYKEMGVRLAGHLASVIGQDVPFLHGGVPTHQRDEMVRRFQEVDGDAQVLIISLRAGGTGLNLTRATHVIHYDRWWNPAVEDQATDRAYRIGQHRNVQVHKLICKGTLEERIDRLLEDKRSLAESVVGSGERLVAELDDAALRALVSLGDEFILEDE